ncbi:37024_t:CDS:2 [Gigaspora margarita]|uniref:37024_t:CDS:1 n=1 Tax=Gigaspora margarita TaxID=4874 RepID=A0ABN7X3V5_GIGMA|nr:37024_t:CDS:2 [Gigaspora margarita]
MVNKNKNEDIQDVEDVVSEVQDVEHVDSEVQNVEHIDNEIQNVEDIENVENVDNEAEDIVHGKKESPYDFSLLCVGYTFQNWNDVDSFFNAYGRQFGFAVIKKRVEHGNDGIIKHRSFGCEFGGTYSPKKIINVNAHREGKSKRQGCKWHINLSFPKGATCIKVTIFVNTHNHELHSEICKFSPKFREFGKDAMNEIEFYTKNGNLSITMQRRLLKAHYPNITFLDSDLANAIQHFKTES